jgi:predicted RNase H-like HicB family nuclease
LVSETSLEPGVFFADTLFMDTLTGYRRHAMKLALVTDLGGDEGYVARIPGFRGLLATGRTRKEALAELDGALIDWIELALKRGIGLPALKEQEALTAA